MKIIRGNEGETREKRGKKGGKKRKKEEQKGKNEAILRSFENNIFNEIIRNTYLQNDNLENIKGMGNLELRIKNEEFYTTRTPRHKEMLATGFTDFTEKSYHEERKITKKKITTDEH